MSEVSFTAGGYRYGGALADPPAHGKPGRRRAPLTDKLGFGASARRLRAERDLTLKQVAAMAGVSWTTVSAIELGQSGAELRTAMAIAGALGTTVDAMITLPTPGASGVTGGGGAGFGAEVRRLRRERGWSTLHLAAAAGVANRTIVKAEAGRPGVTLMVAALLASALGTSVTALAGSPGLAEAGEAA
jgi:transcriptional regulator with XRE-family HTH domain